MSDIQKLRIDVLERTIKQLEETVQRLEQDQEATATAIAVLAEMFRRVDWETNTGTEPNLDSLGKYSLTLEAEEPHKFPIRIAITVLRDNCIRVDFLEDGVNECKHN